MTVGAQSTSMRTAAVFDVVQVLCQERGIVANLLDSNSASILTVEIPGIKQPWKLSVDCEYKGLELPTVYLAPPRGLLPHVGYSGIVCVNDGQGLSVDLDLPVDLAAHTLLAAYDMLEEWAADEDTSKTEFFNELEGYWAGLPGAFRGHSTFEVDGNDRLISAYEDRKYKAPKWHFAERSTQPREIDANKLQAQRGLYVHLDELPTPPAYPEQLTHDYVETLCAAFSPAQRELWDAMVGPSNNGPKRCVLLVSVPRQAGGRSLVGAAFAVYKRKLERRARVVPLTARRQTASHMRERGGASLELLRKHVAVLGCGAVGSVVADTLAAAGVGKLTLVDVDEYSEDNVFRHVLDPVYIGLPKTLGLQHQLQTRYPGLTVESAAITAQQWFNATNLENIDGVVLAFGAPSIERSFARAFRKRNCQLPVVFTWLEALDLGGHSVLMWAGKPGCLDCLYRDEEGSPSLHPRTSFLEPNQHVTRNLTGCASVFVPYGALQARKTGLMAAEQMLSALAGDAPERTYSYWVGQGIQAQERGLRMTPWWATASTEAPFDATARAFGPPCKRCRGGA